MAIDLRFCAGVLVMTMLSGCATDEWVARQYGEPQIVQEQAKAEPYPDPAPDNAGASYMPEYSAPDQYAGSNYSTNPAAPPYTGSAHGSTDNGNTAIPNGYTPSVGVGGAYTNANSTSRKPDYQPASASVQTDAGANYDFIIESE